MAILSGIAAGGGALKAAGVDPVKEVKGLISNVFGSGGRRKDCGSRQRKLAETLNKYLTQSDKQSLVSWHKRTFPGGGIQPTGNSIAYHYFGGGDCRVTESAGKQFQRKVDSKVKNAAQREKSRQTGGGSSPPAADATGGGALGNLLTMQNLLIGGGALLAAFFIFSR